MIMMIYSKKIHCDPKMANIWFDQFCQILVKLFAKNMNSWSVKHEILYAKQSDRAEKKSRK